MTVRGLPLKPGIAFLGTGLMGAPMATRLLAAGHTLTVWNRTPHKAQALAPLGARVAADPAAAVREAHLLIVMLADGASVTDVLFSEPMQRALKTNTTIIDMSSIPPALAQTHARRFSSRHIEYLDAPVSGGTQGARDGTLAIMMGGTLEACELVRPFLEILGRPTRVGPSGSGQLAKLANQAIVAISIGAVAEGLLLAAAGGADPVKVREALLGGFADSAILRHHGQRMLDRDWIPGGMTHTQVKDLRTIAAVAADLNLSLPLVERVTALFESSVREGCGPCDHSALLLELERLNPTVRVGLPPDHRPESR